MYNVYVQVVSLTVKPYQLELQVLTELGGGPSTVRETRFMPRSNTRPRLLFSSLSGPLLLGFILRNSSQSARTRLRWRSNAKKVPMNIRPSSRVIRMRYCMYWLNLPLPDWGKVDEQNNLRLLYTLLDDATV